MRPQGLRIQVLLLAISVPWLAGSSKSSTALAGEPGTDTGAAVWPQFLGPRRNNISTETRLLKQWPPAGLSLIGTIRGLGVGFSNIAVVDGTVYTMGNRGERECVFAFALGRGDKVWEYDNAAAYHNGYGDGPRSTPTVDGELLYALGASGDLICLERASGREVWKKNLVREFGAGIPNWGISESVLIDGDKVICTPGGRSATMAAFDKKTGAVIWKSKTPQADQTAYASMIAVDAGGVPQYVNFTATGVIGMRADNGKFLWRNDSSANGIANCCAPLFADGFVFTSSGYGKGSSLLALSSTGVKLKYHSNELKVHHGGLVLFEGCVYGSNDNNWTCLDLKTGKVKWRDRSVGKGSLTCADGHLYLRSEQGPVALVVADSSGYREVGRFTPGERSKSPAWTYPVVCGQKLFLRDQDLLQVYDIAEK
ncbi:MAG TPA: PQQ-binding-like beta-propeller repeat protein [Planctomycetaceae bacterium]|jgi:outer membrane protein assembly factor BamB|nr:PQQ-binding-like beta-propeller repeat protein [Planctomycetaceae bacterium]